MTREEVLSRLGLADYEIYLMLHSSGAGSTGSMVWFYRFDPYKGYTLSLSFHSDLTEPPQPDRLTDMTFESEQGAIHRMYSISTVVAEPPTTTRPAQ